MQRFRRVTDDPSIRMSLARGARKVLEKALGSPAVGLVVLATASPAFASHLPTPSFPHPGQAQRCQATNPHNNPALSLLPLVLQQTLHDLWHSECDGVPDNGHS